MASETKQEQSLTEPHWGAWKRHLIVCADCTAGDLCAEGRGILGSATPDDAPWLRSGEARQPETSETTVAFSGFNPEQSATLKLRLDVERYNRTGEAVYLDASGREIKFVAASDPWDRLAAPVPVREERQEPMTLREAVSVIHATPRVLPADWERAWKVVEAHYAALDALATAVVPVEQVVEDTERRAVRHRVTEYVVPWVHLRPLLNAISSLLSTRETSHG